MSMSMEAIISQYVDVLGLYAGEKTCRRRQNWSWGIMKYDCIYVFDSIKFSLLQNSSKWLILNKNESNYFMSLLLKFFLTIPYIVNFLKWLPLFLFNLSLFLILQTHIIITKFIKSILFVSTNWIIRSCCTILMASFK